MSSSAEQRQQNDASSQKRRPSELQLDAKWEAAIDVTLRRVVYGCIGGTTMAFLMCRGTTARAAVSAFGAGVGVGSAYEDAAKLFK
jgi:inner membrane organizing system protein 1